METEKRLIFANVLIDELKWLQENVSSASAIEIQEYIDRVNRQPTVDAVEVVHGRWEPVPDNNTYERCSVCKDCYIYAEWTAGEDKWYYCPNCGAKMDLKGDNK